MDPVATCDLLLSYLKLSNLNFHLAESPFSAYIEIRKTFIKDKNGSYRTSCLPASMQGDEKKVIEANHEALIKEKGALQNQVQSFQKNLEQLQINQTILEMNNSELGKALEDKKAEIILLEKSLKNQEAIKNDTIHDLDQAKKII